MAAFLPCVKLEVKIQNGNPSVSSSHAGKQRKQRKQLKGIIEKLSAATIYHTEGERFFTMSMLNSATDLLEPYKVCIAFYREHHLPRI